MDCLFCKIVSGAIPVAHVFEDERVIAIADIHPQAPVHLLVMPKRHIVSLAASGAEDAELFGHLISTAAEIARAQHLDAGYRVVINTASDGGQTVNHLHVHLLGGRQMGWPPG